MRLGCKRRGLELQKSSAQQAVCVRTCARAGCGCPHSSPAALPHRPLPPRCCLAGCCWGWPCRNPLPVLPAPPLHSVPPGRKLHCRPPRSSALAWSCNPLQPQDPLAPSGCACLGRPSPPCHSSPKMSCCAGSLPAIASSSPLHCAGCLLLGPAWLYPDPLTAPTPQLSSPASTFCLGGGAFVPDIAPTPNYCPCRIFSLVVLHHPTRSLPLFSALRARCSAMLAMSQPPLSPRSSRLCSRGPQHLQRLGRRWLQALDWSGLQAAAPRAIHVSAPRYSGAAARLLSLLVRCAAGSPATALNDNQVEQLKLQNAALQQRLAEAALQTWPPAQPPADPSRLGPQVWTFTHQSRGGQRGQHA